MYICVEFGLLQVVKRAGAVLDSAYTDPVPAVGAKRSVHDRLGTQPSNKRCFFSFELFRYRG